MKGNVLVQPNPIATLPNPTTMEIAHTASMPLALDRRDAFRLAITHVVNDLAPLRSATGGSSKSSTEHGLRNDLQFQKYAGGKRPPCVEKKRERSLGASLPTLGRDDQNAGVHVDKRHGLEASSWS